MRREGDIINVFPMETASSQTQRGFKNAPRGGCRLLLRLVVLIAPPGRKVIYRPTSANCLSHRFLCVLFCQSRSPTDFDQRDAQQRRLEAIASRLPVRALICKNRTRRSSLYQKQARKPCRSSPSKAYFQTRPPSPCDTAVESRTLNCLSSWNSKRHEGFGGCGIGVGCFGRAYISLGVIGCGSCTRHGS